MTLDDHADAFLAYVAGLLGDFDRYIAAEPEHPGQDGAGSRADALHRPAPAPETGTAAAAENEAETEADKES